MVLIDIVISLLLVLLAFVLMKATCRITRLRQPTFLGFAFLSFIVMQYIPSLIFLADEALVQSRRFFWACTLALVMMALGGAFINLILRFRPERIGEFYRVAVNTAPTRRTRSFVYVYGIVCALIFVMYLIEVPAYPLFLLLTGRIGTAEANALRNIVLGPDMGSSLWYLYGVSRSALMPWLFVLVFSIWPYFVKSERFLMASFMIMVLVYNSWSGAKTPTAMIFALSALVMLMRTNKNIGRRKVPGFSRRVSHQRERLLALFMLLLAVSYPVFIFRFKSFGQDRSLLDILYTGVLRRVAYIPAFTSYLQFEYFPAVFNFTYLRDIPMFAALIGAEPINLSILTSLTAYGTDSYAPPTTVGNFYAQAGFLMVILGFFLVGVMCQAMQVWVIRWVPKGPFSLAIMSVLCYGGFRISMSDFYSVFLSETIVPTLLVVGLWTFYRRLQEDTLGGRRSVKTEAVKARPLIQTAME